MSAPQKSSFNRRSFCEYRSFILTFRRLSVKPPQGEYFKITPEKLVVPVNDHLDIKISCIAPVSDSYVDFSSFAFDLIRAWYVKNGKEEEYTTKPDSFTNYHDFEKDADLYFRVKLTENADPCKRIGFSEEKPEGFLMISYFIQRKSKTKKYPLILISENEKVLEMRKRFVELRKIKDRRERSRDEEELKEWIKKHDPDHADKEDVNKSVLKSDWSKLDEMSDYEIKKLKLERKKEMEEREREQEKTARLEAAQKKKKCVIM
uniref:MSP domain-containing protein n=1 Tax=Caenorhabditis tropicalis TaxID=1561998 RepID=A0A1I7UPH2_9PELO